MKTTICLFTAIAGVLFFLFQCALLAQLPSKEPPLLSPEVVPQPPQRVQGIIEDLHFPIPIFANSLVKSNEKDDPIKKLQREQLSQALVCVEVCGLNSAAGNSMGFTDAVTNIQKFNKLAVVAAFDLADTREQKIECLEFLVDASKRLERMEDARRRYSSALGSSAAKYWRLEAEINLLKFKRDSAPAKVP